MPKQTAEVVLTQVFLRMDGMPCYLVRDGLSASKSGEPGTLGAIYVLSRKLCLESCEHVSILAGGEMGGYKTTSGSAHCLGSLAQVFDHLKPSCQAVGVESVYFGPVQPY